MKIILKVISLFVTSQVFFGCAARANLLVLPDQSFAPRLWTMEEKTHAIAMQTLYIDRNASYHLVRLEGSEVPHVHAKHDLSVIVRSGKSMIHFEDRSVLLREGDVVRILSGLPHWAENLGKRPSEVYAIFSPPFYGDDTVPV